MFKLKNVIESPVRSLLGTGGGVPILVEGIQEKNWIKIVGGALLLVVGLFTSGKPQVPQPE